MTNKINGIDVSEYFIDVVDEGGSTIDYKILPNSERLLVEKIFEQNQQLKRLQEENKRLQMLSCANCGEKYLSPDGAELYEKNVQLQKENEELKKRLRTLDEEEFVYEVTEIEYNNFKKMNKYKQALEEIRGIAKEFLKELCDDCAWYNTDECNPEGYTCGEMKKIINKINEALNDN